MAENNKSNNKKPVTNTKNNNDKSIGIMENKKPLLGEDVNFSQKNQEYNIMSQDKLKDNTKSKSNVEEIKNDNKNVHFTNAPKLVDSVYHSKNEDNSDPNVQAQARTNTKENNTQKRLPGNNSNKQENGSVFSSYVDPKKDKNLQEEPRKSDNTDQDARLNTHTTNVKPEKKDTNLPYGIVKNAPYFEAEKSSTFFDTRKSKKAEMGFYKSIGALLHRSVKPELDWNRFSEGRGIQKEDIKFLKDMSEELYPYMKTSSEFHTFQREIPIDSQDRLQGTVLTSTSRNGKFRFATTQTLWSYTYDLKEIEVTEYGEAGLLDPIKVKKLKDVSFKGKNHLGDFSQADFSDNCVFAVDVKCQFHRWDLEAKNKDIKCILDENHVKHSDRECSQLVALRSLNDDIVFYADIKNVYRLSKCVEENKDGKWKKETVLDFTKTDHIISNFIIGNNCLLLYLNGAHLYIFKDLDTYKDRYQIKPSKDFGQRLKDQSFTKIHFTMLKIISIQQNVVIMVTQAGKVFLYNLLDGNLLASMESCLHYKKVMVDDEKKKLESSEETEKPNINTKENLQDHAFDAKPIGVVLIDTDSIIQSHKQDSSYTMDGKSTLDNKDNVSMSKYDIEQEKIKKTKRKILVVGYDTGDIVIINLENNKQFRKQLNKQITSIHYSEDTKYQFILCQTSEVILFNVQNNEEFTKTLFSFVGAIYSVATTFDHLSVYVGGRNGVVKQISIKDHAQIEDQGRIHDGTVNSIICSPDEKNLFTADSTGQIKMFSLEKDNRHECYSFTIDDDKKNAHKYEIRCLDITGDNEHLFSADKKGILKQWSIRDKTLSEDYGEVCNCEIYSIVCTPDSKYVFVSNETGYVAQYNVGTKAIEKPFFKIHQGEIYSMACSPDSNWLFTSDTKGNLKQYSIIEQEVKHDYGDVHSGKCYKICTSPDSNYVFTSDSDGEIKQFSLKQRRLLKKFGKVHNSPILAMAVSKDSKILITSDFSGKVKQFRIKEKDQFIPIETKSKDDAIIPIETKSKDDEPANETLEVSKDNRYVFASDDKGGILMYDWYQEKSYPRKFATHDENKQAPPCVKSIVTSYNNEYVFFGDSKGLIFVFMPNNKDMGGTLEPVSHVDCSDEKFQARRKKPDGKYDDIKINEHVDENKESGGIECMCISKDDKCLIVGFNKKLIQFTINKKELDKPEILIEECDGDQEIGKNFDIKNYGPYSRNDVEFGFGNIYIIASDTTAIKVYLLETRKLCKIIKQHEKPVTCQTLTPDGKYMFSADQEGKLIQWEMTKIKMQKNYDRVHQKRITSLVVTRDSKYLFLAVSRELFLISIQSQKVIQDLSSLINQSGIQDEKNQIDKIGLSNTLCKLKDNAPTWKYETETNMYLVTDKNKIFYINLDTFISDEDYWEISADYLVPYGIKTFNYTRNYNFLTSLLLNKVYHMLYHLENERQRGEKGIKEKEEEKFKDLRHFINENKDEITKELENCSSISDLDFRNMLYILTMLDYKMYIPDQLQSMLNNKTAGRIRVNDILSDLMICLDESIGSRVIRLLLDYMFVLVPNLDRGTRKLIQEDCVKSSESAMVQNSENLDYTNFNPGSFEIKTEEKGPLEINVYKWNFQFEFDNPGKDFVSFQRKTIKWLKKDNQTLKEEKIVKLIRYLWDFYQKIFIYYLCVSSLAFTSQFIYPFVEGDKTGRLVVLISLLVFTGLMVLFESMRMISMIKNYFYQPKHWINLATIALYIGTAVFFQSYPGDWGDDDWIAVTIYDLALFVGTIKVYYDMNAVNYMRDLNSSQTKILYDIKAFLLMCVLFMISFTTIFYQADFYSTNYCSDESDTPDPKTCYTGTYWYFQYTYDQFFGNWNWGSPTNSDVLWVITPIFIIYVLLFPIVNVNLLIALVTSSYEEHMDKLESEDNKRKIQLIIEIIEIRHLINRFKDFFKVKKERDCNNWLVKELNAKTEIRNKETFINQFRNLDNLVYIYTAFEKQEEKVLDKSEWREEIKKNTTIIDCIAREANKLETTESEIDTVLRKVEELCKIVNRPIKKQNEDGDAYLNQQKELQNKAIAEVFAKKAEKK